MNYEDLLNSHKLYGTTKANIIKRNNYEKILENVVIAPCWNHNMFDELDTKIEKINDKVFNIYMNKISFSFIELKLVGAPVIMDEVLSLGVSNCKKILFIGSVGSIDENIKIGDIIVLKYSIDGVGATRYLNRNLLDNFGNKEYPNEEETNKLLRTISNNTENYNYHYVVNYSVDTIFAQFNYIDKIKNMGAKTIEMETSAFFKASRMANLNATALLIVSDNTAINKSLYSGRTEEERETKKYVKNKILPRLIIKYFES